MRTISDEIYKYLPKRKNQRGFFDTMGIPAPTVNYDGMETRSGGSVTGGETLEKEIRTANQLQSTVDFIKRLDEAAAANEAERSRNRFGF